MARALKVFRTTIGFHEAIVAAPSQAAALRAWDVRENLFTGGMASLTDDPAAVEAATARPGEVLRRPTGSPGPFAVEPDAPAMPPPARRAAPGKRAAKAEPPPPPDRSALDAAEKALAGEEADHARALQALEDERAKLDARRSALETAHERRRAGLSEALDQARRAYAKAGG